MGNIISANVSEEVEKISTDMKKIITNASLKFTQSLQPRHTTYIGT